MMRTVIDCPIIDIVPHAGPMCLLDRALEADADSLVAELAIRPDNPFMQAEGVPGWVGIEYMAQAIAAWAGWQARLHGQPPKVGFLLGSRRYNCTRSWLRTGDNLHIEILRQFQSDNGLGQFDCRISCAGELIADAALTVFEPADTRQFLMSNES